MNREYLGFIKELKQSITESRYTAARLVNQEQLLLYLRIGMRLSEEVAAHKWGAGVLVKLADDLQRELPGLRGFSHRNLKKMRQFYEAYYNTQIGCELVSMLKVIGPPLVAQLPQRIESQLISHFFGIGFSHHVTILNACDIVEERWFYISKAAVELWSRRTLEHHIASDLFKQSGRLPNNFREALPTEIRGNALEVFRDNYLFDFLELEESNTERMFEGQMVAKIRDSIMALGKGFCFLGNQFRLDVDGQEFFIDLVFYNRVLRCLVAFELKTGKFKPEYAGQLNFYLNVLDDKVKMPEENPSIGIILCKEKNNTVVEYAFQNISRGMGAATFRTSQKVPDDMKGILPDAKELAKLL